MKSRIIAIALSLCCCAWALQDMAGRTVSVKTPVASVYSTSPVGEIFLYTLSPEMVAGICWSLRPREKAWLLPAYANLPVLGGWFGKSSSANLEEIVRIHPGAIVSAGLTDPMAISSADDLQDKTGLPVVVVDGSFERIPQSYRFLGDFVGRRARADSLAAWASKALSEGRTRTVARRSRGIQPKVYYAEGLQGLETDPGGSKHTELVEWVGAKNVAKVPLQQGFGRSPVSFEQILSWDPDWILVGEDHTDTAGDKTWSKLASDPRWKLLGAVKAHRIVRIPDQPFNWFDRPPAPSRLLGALWLESVLFPQDLPRAAFLAKMREFFRLFYHRSLSPADEAKILEGAWPG
jgi:iron complex transport system substrate-binding protein